MLKLPTCQEIHRQRCSQRRHFDQVPRFLPHLAPQLHPLAGPADGVDQPAHDRTLDAGPVGNLLDQLRPVAADDIGGGARLTAATGEEDLAQMSVCLLYTSPSPRDGLLSRMPSSA